MSEFHLEWALHYGESILPVVHMAFTASIAILLVLLTNLLVGALTPRIVGKAPASVTATSDYKRVGRLRARAAQAGGVAGALAGAATWAAGALDATTSAILAVAVLNAVYLALSAGELVDTSQPAAATWLLGFYRTSSRIESISLIALALVVVGLSA